MTIEKSEKTLLVIAAIGLIPIALGYGFMPEKTLTPLYGFPVDSVNLKHIMRAVMGLYFWASHHLVSWRYKGQPKKTCNVLSGRIYARLGRR
jgi:hypothetical protein